MSGFPAGVWIVNETIVERPGRTGRGGLKAGEREYLRRSDRRHAHPAAKARAAAADGGRRSQRRQRWNCPPAKGWERCAHGLSVRGSVRVSDSRAISAIQVSEPIEECSTSTTVFSPTATTAMPMPACTR